MINFARLIIFFWGMSLTFAYAQKRDSLYTGKGRYFVQLASTGLSTTERTAFWLHTNQNGTVPSNPQALMGYAGIYYEQPLSPWSKKWVVDGALEGMLLSNPKKPYSDISEDLPGNASHGVVTEGYLRIKYKKWELYGGRKREFYGLVDTVLTSGGLVWSNNTLPIPQIRLGTYDFIKVPYVGDWLRVKGFFSHGWFENSRPFDQNVYLHTKGLYLKIGKDNAPFKFHTGFTHMVQWGGYAPSLKDDPGLFSKYGYFNKTWEGFWSVVSGKRMDKYLGYPLDDFISVDVNRVGNHLGTIDVGLEWNSSKFNIFFYRQSTFDDGSLFYLLNINDGLNGIRWLNKNKPKSNLYIQRVTLEWLSTVDQGGPVFDINDPKQRGKDNYYNHSQYRDGWTYFGQTIGTGFIPPDHEMKSSVRANSILLTDNRVEVAHVGLAGRYKNRISWEIKGSYSKNYGTYNNKEYYGTANNPFANNPLPQFSGIIRIGTKLSWFGGSEISGAVALDNGKIYDNTLGAYLSIRKVGLIGRYY
ncbi:MAG: capsule assembly Wzi family protein [Siphonobacter sp.]